LRDGHGVGAPGLCGRLPCHSNRRGKTAASFLRSCFSRCRRVLGAEVNGSLGGRHAGLCMAGECHPFAGITRT
jgi:hypothetical protein